MTERAPEPNRVPFRKEGAGGGRAAPAGFGCGAGVAACKNASAVLFVGAKISHLTLVPQGHPERERRVLAMVAQMEQEGFGACSNEGECEAVCPKEISVGNIQRLTREYARARWKVS